MSIEYTNTPLEWQNGGAEPSTSLKQNGFSAGYKPAANTFNYQFSNSTACISELQTKLSSLDDEKVDKVTGKGLSTNDFTNTEKSKLSETVGKDLTGKTVNPTSATTTTAGNGAEIFSDYRARTYNGEGSPTAGNVASGVYSHAEGEATTASGVQSHAEGCGTIASHDQTHAEGYFTKATSNCAHAEGASTTASGAQSHAEGLNTTASGTLSHAEGHSTTAIGAQSHAEGSATIAGGVCSHAGGHATQAVGDFSQTGGQGTYANKYQFTHGRYNKTNEGPTSETDMSGNLFIIGCGTEGANRQNALRTTTDGKTYGLQNFAGSGADFAELFEWQDENINNEDRRGLFVTLAGEKIKIASPSDSYILGAVSAVPTVCGDVQSEMWKHQYLTDVFGEKIVETVEVAEAVNEFGVVVPTHIEKRWVLNPDYDPTQEYISRENRPEWTAVGLIGKLVVVDDGTCQAGGFCKVAEGGIATSSENNNGWKVLKRIDNNHIQIIYR